MGKSSLALLCAMNISMQDEEVDKEYEEDKFEKVNDDVEVEGEVEEDVKTVGDAPIIVMGLSQS